MTMHRRTLGGLLLAAFALVPAAALLAPVSAADPKADEQGYVSLFDGKTLDGWKINENPQSWKVEDGAIVVQGQPRSHLFYVGDDKPFKNFELLVDAWTEPGSNAGIYFHTKFQPDGWPKYGYEIQVNNTHGDPKKTASVYAVKDVLEAPAKDKTWFTYKIVVKEPTIQVYIDGKLVNEFTEEPGRKPGKDFTRKLDEGTFALQGHDPKSIVKFKNIKVKRLD